MRKYFAAQKAGFALRRFVRLIFNLARFARFPERSHQSVERKRHSLVCAVVARIPARHRDYQLKRAHAFAQRDREALQRRRYHVEAIHDYVRAVQKFRIFESAQAFALPVRAIYKSASKRVGIRGVYARYVAELCAKRRIVRLCSHLCNIVRHNARVFKLAHL